MVRSTAHTAGARPAHIGHARSTRRNRPPPRRVRVPPLGTPLWKTAHRLHHLPRRPRRSHTPFSASAVGTSRSTSRRLTPNLAPGLPWSRQESLRQAPRRPPRVSRMPSQWPLQPHRQRWFKKNRCLNPASQRSLLPRSLFLRCPWICPRDLHRAASKRPSSCPCFQRWPTSFLRGRSACRTPR